MLVERNPEVNLRSAAGSTPLFVAVFCLGPYVLVGNVVDIVQQLPEHGTDTHIPDCSQSLLREASSRGSLEVARLLLSYGANIDEKNWPYQGDATKSLDSH